MPSSKSPNSAARRNEDAAMLREMARTLPPTWGREAEEVIDALGGIRTSNRDAVRMRMERVLRKALALGFQLEHAREQLQSWLLSRAPSLARERERAERERQAAELARLRAERDKRVAAMNSPRTRNRNERTEKIAREYRSGTTKVEALAVMFSCNRSTVYRALEAAGLKPSPPARREKSR